MQTAHVRPQQRPDRYLEPVSPGSLIVSIATLAWQMYSDRCTHTLLTVEQVAEVLHISRNRVYYLIRSGLLRSIKIGKLRRIAREWVAEFVRHQETPRT